MSSTEIIVELPKLTHEERRAICQSILTLEADQEVLESNRQAALLGFQMLDQMESEAGQKRIANLVHVHAREKS